MAHPRNKFKKTLLSSITFELKKQIYFFLVQSDKKISFETFNLKLTTINLQIMTTTSSSTAISRKDYIFSITIIGLFFFIFGFVTWLNGILIPFLRTACELNDFEAYFVTFAFYVSYLVMALPSSALLKKTGFKNGMSIGLWIMAAGALIFIPAAMTRTFGLFLLGLFVEGTGLALLQTASNPYITIIGPPESAAKRISIMGIANKFAGAIAPIILASIILKDSKILEEKLAEAADAAYTYCSS